MSISNCFLHVAILCADCFGIRVSTPHAQSRIGDLGHNRSDSGRHAACGVEICTILLGIGVCLILQMHFEEFRLIEWTIERSCRVSGEWFVG